MDLPPIPAAPADPAPTVAPKLALRGVGKTFTRAGGQRVGALQGVDLDVAPGEFVCIIGPTGCGKSTVLDLLAGFQQPDEGQVLLDGAPVQGPGSDRVMLFQDSALFPWMSIVRNVEYALKLRGVSAANDRREQAMGWLRKVHLDGFADAMPHELSGGMRQRAALARGLACEPEVMLADEPFGSLDAQSREFLQHELEQLWTDSPKTFVFVTHNVREAVFLADRVVLMSARPGSFVAEHRLVAPRPRSLDDALLASVIHDVHDHLLKEVHGAPDEL